MRAMSPHPSTWLKVLPAGLYLRARRVLHRPAARGRARDRHPRPFRPRPARHDRARQRRNPRADAGTAWARTGPGSAAGIAVGRADHDRRVRSGSCRRARAGQRAGGDGIRGSRAVVSGDYKRARRPDLRAVRAGAVRRVRHRGDLRAAGLPPSAAGQRSAGCSPSSRCSPTQPRHRLLRAGKCQRLIALLRAGRLGPADLAARRAGPACATSTGARRRPRRSAARHDGGEGELVGRDRAGPARRLADRWARRLADPVVGWRPAGCASASARKAARRRAAAGHLRPRRLGRTARDPRRRRARRKSG